MTIVGFIPGPSHVLGTSPDDRPTRFCFNRGCREHLPHTWVMLDYPPERQPTYYEPIVVLRCSRCGKDRADFPGTYWEGPRPVPDAVWEYLVEQAQAERATWDWEAIMARFRSEHVPTEYPQPICNHDPNSSESRS